jgi:hypothetical protein
MKDKIASENRDDSCTYPPPCGGCLSCCYGQAIHSEHPCGSCEYTYFKYCYFNDKLCRSGSYRPRN